jgi:hypothetical protein
MLLDSDLRVSVRREAEVETPSAKQTANAAIEQNGRAIRPYTLALLIPLDLVTLAYILIVPFRGIAVQRNLTPVSPEAPPGFGRFAVGLPDRYTASQNAPTGC